MRYHCLHIKTDFAEEWQKDVLAQQLCDLGVDTIDGEDAYIQSAEWETRQAEIEALCAATEGVRLVGVEACPDENWNAVWEADHPVQDLPLGIRIIPHCAFGAGHHETTSMMIEHLIRHFSLIAQPAYRVLDHGTGTGVLAIFAKRLGAASVTAVDIDEKSVTNARENAALNGETIDVRWGDTVPGGPYDLIVANIHRNVLLANMHAYATQLSEGGELWLSGFYADDCAPLREAVEHEGMQVTDVIEKNGWQLMKCRKEARC